MSETILPPTERPFLYLWEILEDPDALKPPEPIAPRLAWSKRLTLLAAREKTGKSTLASAAAAAVSRGTSFLGAATSAGNVLIISLEENRAEFAQRLVKFGADPARIAVVERGTGTGDLRADIWRAAEIHQPALIIWDTLGAFANEISGKPLDPGDAQGWTAIMIEILDVARTFGASLLLHHAKKSDGTYRDSTAIGASVDVILEMHGEGNEPRVLKAKGRFEVPEIRIRLDDDAFHLIETSEDIKKRVYDFVVANRECSMNAIYAGVSARAKEVTRARDALISEKRIKNVLTGQGHMYVASHD